MATHTPTLSGASTTEVYYFLARCKGIASLETRKGGLNRYSLGNITRRLRAIAEMNCTVEKNQRGAQGMNLPDMKAKFKTPPLDSEP